MSRVDLILNEGKKHSSKIIIKPKKEFDRIVDFEPAYDRTSGGHGIGAVRIRFVLKNKKGAVQFLIGTGWYLDKKIKFSSQEYPNAWDLGYHSPKPKYEGHEVTTKRCEHLDGRPCYYDGSGLNGEPLVDVLLKEGSYGVWRELEKYHKETFSEEEK